MKKYQLFSVGFILSLILLGFSGVNTAQAARMIDSGCNGDGPYSTLTGQLCNAPATSNECATGDNFSYITGLPCKGTTTVAATPTITSILPEGCLSNTGYSNTNGWACSSAPIGGKVYIHGSGFTSTNNSIYRNDTIVDLFKGLVATTSADGQTLQFTVPSSVTGQMGLSDGSFIMSTQNTYVGDSFPVMVSNSNGQSNTISFYIAGASSTTQTCTDPTASNYGGPLPCTYSSSTLTITTPSQLPSATVGQPYSTALNTSGGSSNYSYLWSVNNGAAAFPVTGLGHSNIYGSTINIVGIPAPVYLNGVLQTSPYTFTFTENVTNGSQTATKQFSLIVNPATTYTCLDSSATNYGGALPCTYPTPTTSTITVTSPAGGEQWAQGSTQTISWTDSSATQVTPCPPQPVCTTGRACPMYRVACPLAAVQRSYNITLEPVSGNTAIGISVNTTSTSFSWTIPSSVAVGSYTMQIGRNDNRFISGSSNQFSIVSGMTTSSSLATPTLVVGSTTSSQYISSSGSGAVNATQVTYNFVSNGNNLTIKELRFVTNTTNAATAVALNSPGIATVSVPFVNYVADMTGLNIPVPNNSSGLSLPVFVSYAPVNTNGGIASGTKSYLLLTDVTYLATGGAAFSQNISNPIQTPVMTLVASKPTITLNAPNKTVTSGTDVLLGTVTVTADNSGDIALQQIPLTVSINSGTGGTANITSVKLTDVNDITLSNFTAYGCTAIANSSTSCNEVWNSGSHYRISAGQSKTFEVHANIAGSFGTSASVSFAMGSAGGFIWDDMGGQNIGNLTGTLIYSYPTGSINSIASPSTTNTNPPVVCPAWGCNYVPPVIFQNPTISQVQNLSATASGTSVNLSWSAGTASNGVGVYNIYRSTTAGFTPSTSTLIVQGNVLSYVDSGLSAGTYYYAVALQDAQGNIGKASIQASATVASTSSNIISKPIANPIRAINTTF